MEEKPQTLTSKYLLGFSLALILIFGSYILSEQPVENGKLKGQRNLAEFLDPNQHLARLTRADRIRLKELMDADKCYKGNVIDQNSKSCGAFNHWPDGDPSFTWDPLMNMVPRKTEVHVDFVCNENTGQFNTRVYFPSICPLTKESKPTGECGEFYFRNPYTQNRDSPFSRSPDNWLASPGLFNHNDVTNLTNRNQPSRDSDLNITSGTDLNTFDFSANVNSGAQAGAQLHIVSDAKEWEGAPMLSTLWFKDDYAAHAMCEGYSLEQNRGPKPKLKCDFSGRPASKGCIRLEPSNAKALYNLVRRVGTKHVRYQFHGYGKPLARLGGRPACSLSAKEWEQFHNGRPLAATTPSSESTSVTESRQSFNWFKNAWEGLKNFFRGNHRNTEGSAQ